MATASTTLHAQAAPAAEKKGDLTAFSLYTRHTPDYGPTNNNGVTFGAGYTRYITRWINPGVEFRVKIANGATVDEKFYGGGFRMEKQVSNFHPYGDFLIGKGTITYHQKIPLILSNGKPYLDDSTTAYAYGGGLDYDITKNFAFRGEAQFEKWTMKKYTPQLDLAPFSWSLGVVYRIPFRPFTNR